MRNKLAESLAKNEIQKAKEYVSTSYFALTSIFMFIVIIFFLINPYINWENLLNTNLISNEELRVSALIIVFFFSLRFILMNITYISYAKQLPLFSHLFSLISSILSLIIIYILIKTTKGSLTTLVFVITSMQVFVLLIFSFILFYGPYSYLKPNIKYIKFNKIKDILILGINFFIIRIASIILFSSSNIIITRIYGPEEVTVYNIAYKLFAFLPMFFSLIISPFWSAVTDAVHKDDYTWLRKSLKKLNIISIIFVIFIIIILFLSKYIFKFWVGDRVQIPFLYSIIMAISAIISVFFSPYTHYINGFGKLAFSVRYVAISIILFPFLAIFLAKTELKASGVMMAICIVNFVSLLFQYYQVNLLIKKKAYGIWNK